MKSHLELTPEIVGEARSLAAELVNQGHPEAEILTLRLDSLLSSLEQKEPSVKPIGFPEVARRLGKANSTISEQKHRALLVALLELKRRGQGYLAPVFIVAYVGRKVNSDKANLQHLCTKHGLWEWLSHHCFA